MIEWSVPPLATKCSFYDPLISESQLSTSLLMSCSQFRTPVHLDDELHNSTACAILLRTWVLEDDVFASVENNTLTLPFSLVATVYTGKTNETRRPKHLADSYEEFMITQPTAVYSACHSHPGRCSIDLFEGVCNVSSVEQMDSAGDASSRMRSFEAVRVS